MAKSIYARADFHCVIPLTTRWMDNDVYGHVNNVTYYSYFDTIVNRYLIDAANFSIQHSPVIGFIVQSECNYFSSIAFPEALEGAFRVNRLGNTSVEYGVAIFKEGQSDVSAYGTMTHVFVDRISKQPMPIEGDLRRMLAMAIISN